MNNPTPPAGESETAKVMKSMYAELRLDGKTHEQAMASIRAAMDAAIPHAVDAILREAGIPTKAERAAETVRRDAEAQEVRDRVAAIRARTETTP